MVAQNIVNNLQFAGTNIVTFTSDGIYTPPVNLISALVTCVGGGGGSAGCEATGPGERSVGGAGSGGATTISTYAKAALLPSVAVTVGQGGSGGALGVNDGTAGTASTFLGMSAGGGLGGLSAAKGVSVIVNGVTGGNPSGGQINIVGGPSNLANYSATSFLVSCGGPSSIAPPGPSGTPNPGVLYGGGAGSIWQDGSSPGSAGNDGADGIVIVQEFLAL